MIPPATVAEEVRALECLDLEGLRREWRRRWGEPPKLRSRDLLARAMAYRLQAAVTGDLAASTRRRLAELADRFTTDRAFTPDSGPNLKPGSCLIREWGGQRHEVAVTPEGFSYQGQPFRSLSQVAGQITGVKWNGLVFFGLKRRNGAAP